MNYHWNWGIFFEPSSDGSGSYLQTLLSGLGWTLATACCAWCLALAMGVVVGILRTTPSRTARQLTAAYVELFRNIPLLVQLFVWYFVLPELLPKQAGDWLKQLPHVSFYTAVLAIGLYMSVRVAEQVRAGIGSVARGLRHAGQAMGFTPVQTYRFVLLPIAMRIVLPPLTSEFLNTIKNTSITLTIGLVELSARAYAIQEQSYQFFEAFSAATVIYLAVNLMVTSGMRLLEKRIAIPGQQGSQ